jgi:hypothetical protein
MNDYPDLAPDQAVRLLGLLASDDKFRERAEREPTEVLREFGLDVPRDQFPNEVRLPPKRKIAELLVVLLQEDVTGYPHGYIVYFVFGHAMPLVEADASG